MPEDEAIQVAGSDNQIVKFIEQQLSVTKSATHSDSLLSPYNPDDIYKKDAEYRIYESMMRDDQVSVAMAIKKDLVLAAGWDIVCDDDHQQPMADDITQMLLDNMSTPFDDAMTEILSSYEFGFSLTEKIFGTREDGAVVLAMLKTRHPATWYIYTDDYGDIEKFEQYSTRANLDIPAKNLIHFINNRKFQNPYGTSDLRTAYEAWFIKNQIKKYYAIFMEKASSPVPIGRYDSGVPPTEVDRLFQILKRFQAKSAMVIPKTMEVEFLESKSNGEVFQKAINIFNLFIGRALYVPDLFGYSGEQTGGGSYSLGEHQINMYFRHINRRRVQLESAINKEIVRPLVINNYGFQETYPFFKLRPVKEDDVFKAIEAWTSAVQSRIYKPAKEEIDHFRSLINFPVVELEDDEPGSEPDQMDEPEGVQGDGEDNQVTEEKADTEENESVGKFAADPYKHADGDFYKRVDFKALESQMSALEKQISVELLPILTEMFADYGKQVADKKIVEKGNLEKIDSLKLKNTKGVLKVIRKNLIKAYDDAKMVAASELMKSNYAALPQDIDERFLAILDNENMNFIRDWEYAISKAARIEIIKAIKDGMPISEVLQNITLNSKVGNAANVALERYARTKTTEVMNKGRQAFFESSDVVTGYQFSAILDNRTCFSADTLVVMADMTLKTISKVMPGDIIIGGNGQPRKVTATKTAIGKQWRTITIKKEKDKEITIQATDNHPFWRVQSGGDRWVEAKDLSQNDEIGRIALPIMREAFPSKYDGQKSKILQPSLLLSQEKGGNGRSPMHGMSEDVSSAQELAGCAQERSNFLRPEVSENKEIKGVESCLDDKRMPNVQEKIQNKTSRIHAKESDSLQQGVSEKTDAEKLPTMQQGIRDSEKCGDNTLQRVVLSEIRDGNDTRDNGEARIRATEYPIRSGSQDREIFPGFCNNGKNSSGDGRELLAFEKGKVGPEERSVGKEQWHDDDTNQNRLLDGRHENRDVEENIDSDIPAPTNKIIINHINTLVKEDYCYDLEIEGVHSFLITELGIIVHNSNICQGLHGKIFARGTQPTPPLHFNCRSLLIPLTKYEKFEPDKKIGSKPINEFIDENIGTGFSKYSFEELETE